MNREQSIADWQMRYLADACKAGYEGPRPTPNSANLMRDHAKLWQNTYQDLRRLPRIFDPERVVELHAKWLRLCVNNKYQGVMLCLHYRDGYKYEDEELYPALEGFFRA